VHAEDKPQAWKARSFGTSFHSEAPPGTAQYEADFRKWREADGEIKNRVIGLKGRRQAERRRKIAKLMRRKKRKNR